nr:uncharacterized protein LOC123761656 [Procambarus clarkii]
MSGGTDARLRGDYVRPPLLVERAAQQPSDLLQQLAIHNLTAVDVFGLAPSGGMSLSGHLPTQPVDFTAALPLAVKPIKQEPLQVARGPVTQVKQEPSRVALFMTQVKREPSQVVLPMAQVKQEPLQVPSGIEHFTTLLSHSANLSLANSERGEGTSGSAQEQTTSYSVSHRRPRMETQGTQTPRMETLGTQTPRMETQGTLTPSFSGPTLASGGSLVLGSPEGAMYLSGQSIPVALVSAGTLPAAMAHSTPLQLLQEREQLRRENEALQSRVFQFQQLFRDKQKLTLVLNKMGISASL